MPSEFPDLLFLDFDGVLHPTEEPDGPHHISIGRRCTTGAPQGIVCLRAVESLMSSWIALPLSVYSYELIRLGLRGGAIQANGPSGW
jgi:hypothetical protein